MVQCQPCPEPSPPWQANPFQHRICRVFSTSADGDDSLSFEDFLDMLSAFSDAATSDIKSNYAFRIFGNPGCERGVLGSHPLAGDSWQGLAAPLVCPWGSFGDTFCTWSCYAHELSQPLLSTGAL